jgi:hypothetical protein
MEICTQKTKAERHRFDTLNMRIDPKLKYLAEIAAREQERTLTSFIERAVRSALTPESVQEEPTPGTEIKTRRVLPMWMDGLWDVDEADRFFLLATIRPDLLTVAEQTTWKVLCNTLTDKGGEINLSRFRALWNEFIGGARRDAGIE